MYYELLIIWNFNRSALVFVFVVAEISWKFLFYAGNYPYYASIMPYAFQLLKLSEHNGCKPIEKSVCTCVCLCVYLLGLWIDYDLID